MSKMTIPVMDVVRFNESDVIVASGAAGQLRAIKFDNSSERDGRITYNNNTYHYEIRSTLYEELGDKTYIMAKSGNKESLEALFNSDQNLSITPRILVDDGWYSWNDTLGAWTHQ